MRVLVCGGRDFTDREWLYSVLDALDPRPKMLVHGAAAGANSLAGEWAYSRGVECQEYPAAWEQHKRAAGPIRNTFMLAHSKPDLVIAFPGGRGTADMIRRAEAAGVPVRRTEKANDSTTR